MPKTVNPIEAHLYHLVKQKFLNNQITKMKKLWNLLNITSPICQDLQSADQYSLEKHKKALYEAGESE